MARYKDEQCRICRSSPALAQAIAFPWISVIVTIVLLKLEWIWAEVIEV